VQRLLKQTTWARERPLEGIRKMLDNTPVKLGAWDGDTLIGFVRALSDGMYKAYIDDVVVDEPYRKRGVGTQLIQRMLEKLKGVNVVFLNCGEQVVAFYKKFGFEVNKGFTLSLQQR
jgi:GNAT superfamily N-acetyltransferase